jgi:hypothetical protein
LPAAPPALPVLLDAPHSRNSGFALAERQGSRSYLLNSSTSNV